MIAYPDLDRKSLGAYMRNVRNRQGLSLQRFEEQFDMAAVLVGSYERGDRNPGVDQLLRWTAALDQRVAVLDPEEVVLTTIGGGEQTVQFVVVTFQGMEIPQQSRGQALTLARDIPGSKVGYRVCKRGPLEFAQADLVDRVVAR